MIDELLSTQEQHQTRLPAQPRKRPLTDCPDAVVLGHDDLRSDRDGEAADVLLVLAVLEQPKGPRPLLMAC